MHRLQAAFGPTPPPFKLHGAEIIHGARMLALCCTRDNLREFHSWSSRVHTDHAGDERREELAYQLYLDKLFCCKGLYDMVKCYSIFIDACTCVEIYLASECQENTECTSSGCIRCKPLWDFCKLHKAVDKEWCAKFRSRRDQGEMYLNTLMTALKVSQASEPEISMCQRWQLEKAKSGFESWGTIRLLGLSRHATDGLQMHPHEFCREVYRYLARHIRQSLLQSVSDPQDCEVSPEESEWSQLSKMQAMLEYGTQCLHIFWAYCCSGCTPSCSSHCGRHKQAWVALFQSHSRCRALNCQGCEDLKAYETRCAVGHALHENKMAPGRETSGGQWEDEADARCHRGFLYLPENDWRNFLAIVKELDDPLPMGDVHDAGPTYICNTCP